MNKRNPKLTKLLSDLADYQKVLQSTVAPLPFHEYLAAQELLELCRQVVALESNIKLAE